MGFLSISNFCPGNVELLCHPCILETVTSKNQCGEGLIPPLLQFAAMAMNVTVQHNEDSYLKSNKLVYMISKKGSKNSIGRCKILGAVFS